MSIKASYPRVNVLGITFDNVSFSQSLSLCVLAAVSGKPYKAVTPNLEISLRASKDRSLSDDIKRADLVLCDGVGVLFLSKINAVFNIIKRRSFAGRLCERIPGCELALSLLELASNFPSCPLSFFLLGGAPGVAAKAAKKIKRKYPDASIAGYIDGYGGLKSASEAIARSGANVIFCCLGSPLQESFASKLSENLPRPGVILCLGGTIDLLAGNAERAPRIMRKFGLEWMYRFAAEPKRMVRFLNAAVGK